MDLKKRYNKSFTLFIFCQLVIIIFLVYLPINSNFKRFANSYLDTQEDIFTEILKKKKSDLLQRTVETGIWDGLYYQLHFQDQEWLDNNLAPIVDNLSYDSVQVFNKDKKKIYSYNKNDYSISPYKLDNYISQAINNIDYQVDLIQDKGRIFLIGISPIVRSTSRFNPGGALIFTIDFNEYYINQKITTYMDQSLSQSINLGNPPEISKFQEIIHLTNSNNRVVGHILLDYTNSFLQNTKELFVRNIILSILILIALFIYMSNFMSKKLARRIERLYSEVETAINRDFDYNIELQGDDEIAGLAKSFNSMASTMREHVQEILKTNDKLHRQYLEIIQSLITAIEIKDPYTRGHSFRVMYYSEMIAKEIDYPDIEHIRMAALLHDVGKIGIPEHILNKPGRLSQEEYEIVKAHPDYGYKILSNIEELKRVKDIIRFHHERVDGKGYPHNLKGFLIPMEARIIAVADTFDAITSDRAYRKGMTVEEALTELKRVKGEQLDATIVDAFLECAKEDNFFDEAQINRENQLSKDLFYESVAATSETD